MFELFSNLQAHHFNIYVVANFSLFIPRQKEMVVSMHIKVLNFLNWSIAVQKISLKKPTCHVC